MGKKYKAVVVVAAGAIIAVAAFLFVREAGPVVIAPPPPTSKPVPLPTGAPRIRALIEIKILSQKSGEIKLSIHWENLPEGTTKLEIFRSLLESGAGALVKTFLIDESSLSEGNAVATISGGQGAYFSAAAMDNSGTILFVSPPAKPASATSSQQSPASGISPAPAPSPQAPAQTSTVPSSAPQTPSSSSSSAPSYTTYYTPQGAISGSSTPQTANFWVQHVDQKIQIGWQNIPSDIDRLVVSRSASANGPWTAMLTQKNPVTDGPYSLQIVDSTLNDPYYYKLDTYQGSASAASYGPLLLEPISE